MKFLIALPEHNYYLWQMLVQINNFQKFGYDEDTIYVIATRSEQKSEILKRIIRKNKSKATIYVYRDDRLDLSYAPSTTANVLKKLFWDYPELSKETFFYIDPDVIFRKKIRFSDILDNDVWYLSDTRSYIGVNYIKSKSDELFERMCEVVGIEPNVVVDNDENAGGAQLLIKNVNGDYWDKVERDSIQLFKLMNDTKQIYSPKAPIQAWTAEMWAVLWNAWYFGHSTKIIKRFDFTWATDNISKWNKTSIYHNAGAVEGNDHLFIKTRYQKSPFNKDIDCDKKYCSSKYVEEIKDTEKNFKEIIF